jgi:hypothetical protein
VVADGAGGGTLAWVAALPVNDTSRLASLLLDGDATRYSVREQGSLRILSRLDRPLDESVAIAPGFLLVAGDEGALARLGPYAWRTLPTNAPPSSAALVAAVPATALAGPVSAGLASQWKDVRAWLSARDEEERGRHGGRAPDFGDPQPILEGIDAMVSRRLALVAKARSASVEVDVGDDDVRVDLRLRPGAEDAGADIVSAMHGGDTRPLSALPASAAIGLLLRGDAVERTDDAREIAEVVTRALGSRARADDSRALTSAIEDWAHGRGDWLAAGVVWNDAVGLSLRTPDREGEAAKALRSIVDLTRRSTIGDPLRHAFGGGAGEPIVAAANVSGVVDATVAAFGPTKSPAVRLAWGSHDGDMLLAGGEHAEQELARLASPERRLGDDPRVSRALAALGSDASLTLIVWPFRLDRVRAMTDAARAPAVLAVGRRGSDVWAHVDVADEIVRDLLRMRAGL